MSAESTVVTIEHFQYLAQRTLQDDALLCDLKTASDDAGIPGISISPEQASFMQVLLKLIRATEVVEVGTLGGYSAISMARALPADGRVRTLEICDKHADFAAEWIAKSDVSGKVEVHRGPAQDVLPRFETGSADAVFIDADKQNYAVYLSQCLRILRPAGLVMVDNAFAFGELFHDNPADPEVPAVRAFNEIIAVHPELHSVIVPIGDGCWVGVKEENGLHR